ncbi:MAG: murein hydrolase activator EnvC family protein [Barnesiella intestinihominis]
MKRNKKNSDFFSKKRSKYKLTFFNESSLEDVWTICFSRFGAIMTAILLIGLIVVAILSVIVGTPVKNLLPGYLKTEERIEMVDKILRVDSLAAEVQRRDAYIKNLASILTGEIKIDSIGQQADSLLSTTTDTLLPESKLMANYIKQYEQEEKYTLNVFTPTTPIDGKLFYPPLKAIKAYNPKEGHFGIDIQCPRNTAVSAVLDGTIVSAGYTIDYGYVVYIQHSNNYLSVYKYNSGILKNIGDKVSGGEKIAVTGWEDGKSSKQSCVAEFQLWHMGQSLDPEKYITF